MATEQETGSLAFDFSAEQEELREAARLFLSEQCPSGKVRAAMESESGYDPALWNRMATELGLQGILIPEDYGGVGLTHVDAAIVLEELGRALYPGPYFATVVLATNAVLTSLDSDACAKFLPGIADGGTIATLALTEEDGRWEPDAVRSRAHRADEGWLLSGRKSFVLDGHVANLILVGARTEKGLSLFAVEGEAPGLERTLVPTLDQTRRLARLQFSGTPCRLIGVEGAALSGLTTTMHIAAVALAAEQVGGAQRCLDISVDYAGAREQFGRPIGAFQAIQHKCADMLIRVESARVAAYYGAWATETDELPIVASLAKAYCSEAYSHCTGETIQIHGGMGYTWEHDAHLHLKRAISSEMLFGDPTYHRELLAQRIGL
jgi:alkylation response protein AidB-like acyl-CoA dehydrogenase